jgi:hypothetical protein
MNEASADDVTLGDNNLKLARTVVEKVSGGTATQPKHGEQK